MSIRTCKTNAPWAYEKVLPREHFTLNAFGGTSEFIETEMFQFEDQYPVEIALDYLIEFELMLHKVNLFFTDKKIGSGQTFREYFLSLGHNQRYFNGFKFQCEVFYCHIGFYHEPIQELVLRFVVSRPCVEGLGLYKIFLWQLILICRRQRFARLLIHFCVPENFEILRSYFGFDEEADRYDMDEKTNCYLTLEKMDRIGNNLPWGLERVIDKWHPKYGIILKNHESFAYETQLNNEYYVNEKFRNIERGQGKYVHVMDKVNLKTPFYGYPDIDTKNRRNEMFHDRRQPFREALRDIPPDPLPLFTTLETFNSGLYIKSEAPPFNVNPIPDHPYIGYPVRHSPTDARTFEYNNTIKESQKKASLNVPIHVGGYWLRKMPNDMIAPDYIGENKSYLGTEYDTSRARSDALRHIYGIKVDEQLDKMEDMQLPRNQPHYPIIHILDNESLKRQLDSLDQLLLRDLNFVPDPPRPKLNTRPKRRINDVGYGEDENDKTSLRRKLESPKASPPRETPSLAHLFPPINDSDPAPSFAYLFSPRNDSDPAVRIISPSLFRP